jgi:hypothetical protein
VRAALFAGSTLLLRQSPEQQRRQCPRKKPYWPRYYNWDMSLRKSFSLPREGTGLMLQADAFNVFNRANLGNPSTTVATENFGLIGTANPAHQLQFGARFAF